MSSTRELPPRERPTEPATSLAVASLVLGACAVALGVTLVWCFLALPLALGAIGCAIAERRRSRRRTGTTAGGIVTAGLVLGCIAVPLSFGGLVVIPQLRGAVHETIDLTQDDVSDDLTSIERSFNSSVDDLDRTLSDNVDQSTASLADDFDGLERSSREELRSVEDRLSAIISELERTTSTDLDRLETAADTDLTTLESSLRDDVTVLSRRVEEVESRLAAEQGALEARIRALEGGAAAAAGGP